MLARLVNDVLTLRSVDGSFVREIDLGGFRAITSLRIDPSARALALTAVSGTGQEPDVRAGRRGDLRLHVVDVVSGQRRTLTKSYAHDAAFLPDATRIAFHTGQGVAIVHVDDGREEHRFDVGRFGWGPPSISVSPAGQRVALVKWRGDSRKLAVYDLVKRAGSVLRPSCLHYEWWTEDRIAYDNGRSIYSLDIATGQTKLWLLRATDIVETETLCAAVTGVREVLAERIVDHVEHPILNVDGRVYFLLFLAKPGQRVTAIVSLTDRKQDLKVHAVGGNQSIRGFMILNEGHTLAVSFERYDGTTVVDCGLYYVGRGADGIPAGFWPLPRRATPEFGFHAMPR